MPGSRLRVGLVLNALAFALLIGAILWWPLWRHLRPPVVPAEPAAIEVHRGLPDDGTLDVVAAVSMLTDHPPQGELAVEIAGRLLQGELAWPYFAPVKVDLGFAPTDLAQGPPVIQLFQVSLVVPEMLLRAWDHTRDDRYRRAAGRYLEAFVRYEARQQFPTGMLHNSHALANRASVLAHYWRAVRDDRDGFPTAADAVHTHAVRLGALLADPAHFVSGTNHGVMQNVALLQLAVGFPRLPEATRWRELALQRFALQRRFWLAPEGPVLEHAAGYHFHGVVLLGQMLRLLAAGGLPVPEGLRGDYERARDALAMIQRPDGTLPAYGNTFRYAWRLPALLGIDDTRWDRALAERPSFAAFLPTPGWAVWWSAPSEGHAGSHAFIPWGYFPRHGHRRAQEMSLLLWADGHAWATNTGYWPGDDLAGLEAAADWAGSNAPHVVGESPHAARGTTVRAHVAEGPVRFIDMERRVDHGPTLRRQVVQVGDGLWFVLDLHDDAAGRPMRVVWTADPELAMASAGKGVFTLTSPRVASTMQVQVVGNDDLTVAPLSGSRQPFGGWVAFDRRAWPAPALDLRVARPGGWVLTQMRLSRGAGASGAAAPRLDLRSPEDWSLEFEDGATGRQMLVRQGPTLRWSTFDPAGDQRFALVPLTGSAAVRQSIDESHARLSQQFPRFRTREPQRAQASGILAVLGLVACLSVAAAGVWRPRWVKVTLVIVNLGWVASAVVLLRWLGS